MPTKIRATKINKSGKEINSSKIKEGECIFPFLHQGSLRNECIEGKNGNWCATELNEKKQMTKFGYCPLSWENASISNSSSNSISPKERKIIAKEKKEKKTKKVNNSKNTATKKKKKNNKEERVVE